jgi:hypothetical protein
MVSEDIREEAREFLQKHPLTARELERGDEYSKKLITKIRKAAGVE